MVLPLMIPAAVSLASEFFPLLVSKISGSRAGEVAEKVVETAAGVAGLEGEKDPLKIIAALKGDSEKADAVRFHLEQLNLDEHQKVIDDRMSARAYQAQVGPQGRRRGDWMLTVVGVGLVACIGVVVVPQLMGASDAITETEIALISTIAGALLKMFSDAFAFEFGTSRASEAKDDQIAALKENLMKFSDDRHREKNTIIARQQAQLTSLQGAPADPGATAPLPRPRPAGAQAAGAATGHAAAPRDFVGRLIAGQV
jgi:hypothetical protein